MGTHMDLDFEEGYPTREEIETRLTELNALPHAGKLAKKLREQRGLTERALAHAIKVPTRDIKMVEAEGRVRVLRDSRFRSAFNLEAPGQAIDDSKLERFLELLDPSPGQRAILLQDLSGEIEFEKMALLMELMDLDQREYSASACCCAPRDGANGGERAAFTDPWEGKPKPKLRKRKRQRVAAVSPLHAIGSTRTPHDVPDFATTAGHATAPVDSRIDEAPRQDGARRYRLQLVGIDGDGGEEVIDVAILDKRMERPEHVGLTLV